MHSRREDVEKEQKSGESGGEDATHARNSEKSREK